MDDVKQNPDDAMDDGKKDRNAYRALQLLDQPMTFLAQENVIRQFDELPVLRGSVSITLWIKLLTVPRDWNVIFHQGSDPHRTPSMWIIPNDTSLHVRLSTSTSTNAGIGATTSKLKLGKWHHLGVVINPKTSKISFYFDGRLDVETSFSGRVVFQEQPLYIGHDTRHTSFLGFIKRFRYYAATLTHDEILIDRVLARPVVEYDKGVTHSTKLQQDFKSLLNNPNCSDIVFKIGDETIYAHKCILMTRCIYFQKKFNSGMKDAATKCIDVKFEKDAFMCFLQFLYTASVSKDVSDAVLFQVLEVADFYLMTDLKLFCVEELIIKYICFENIFSMLLMMDEFKTEISPYRFIQMKLKLFKFSCENLDFLLKKEEFMKLPQNIIRQLLQYDRCGTLE